MLLCVQSRCVLSLLCLVRCSEHLTLRADPTGRRADELAFRASLSLSLSMEIVEAEREGPLGKWKGPRSQSQSNDEDQTRPFAEGRNMRLAEAQGTFLLRSRVCWKSSRRGGGSRAPVRWTPRRLWVARAWGTRARGVNTSDRMTFMARKTHSARRKRAIVGRALG